jgi:hypothetical protein
MATTTDRSVPMTVRITGANTDPAGSTAPGIAAGVTYWRQAAEEVDFVVSRGPQDWAVEVKSGRGGKVSGLAAFRQRYPKTQAWLVGATSIKLEEFVSRPATEGFQ